MSFLYWKRLRCSRSRNGVIRELALAVLFVCFSASATSALAGEPRVMPLDWVWYDSEKNASEFMQTHARLANQKKLTPYVYIYSDRSRNCRAIRSLVKKRNDLKTAFADSYVILMSFEEMASQYKPTSRRGQWRYRDFTRMLMRVSEDGKTFGEVFLPEVYLYRPELIADENIARKYRSPLRAGPMFKSQFARYVDGYLKRTKEP